MSEVLLKQLQQILAPWDALPENGEPDEGGEQASSAPRQNSTATDLFTLVSPNTARLPALHASRTAAQASGRRDPPAAEADAAAAAERARTATTKLELARAALAVFASNAGVYRPLLVKLFRFLFDHVDALRVEQGQMRLERCTWLQQTQGKPGTAAPVSSGLVGATPKEQNAVAAAYEKVRLTEARMAALVEEAAVQRDHFRSQMETLKRQQYHLEDLLRHQMELTQMLLDHQLQQDVTSGKPSTALPLMATHTLMAARAPGGFGVGAGAIDGRAAPTPSASSAAAATTATRDLFGLEQPRAPVRPPERRDAAYVQRLITRAENQHLLERTEDQLREMRTQHDGLHNKVQSLLKLNTRYARQSVELSARLSILHEHNIALAADVQLFQRDFVRERQRTERLMREVLVARGLVLTMMQIQFGQQASFEDEDGGEPASEVAHGALRPRSESELKWSKRAGKRAAEVGPPVQYAFESPAHSPSALSHATTPAVTPTSNGAAASPNAEAPKPQLGKQPPFKAVATLDPEAQVEAALRLVPGKGLRSQIKDLLSVSDPQHAGIIKSSLLQILHLHRDNKGGGGGTDGEAAAKGDEAQGWLSPSAVRQWVPPYGVRPEVPLQLRSRTAVPLLQLNPVVAEVFVHELLSQRLELLWYSRRQLEERELRQRAAAGGTIELGRRSGVNGGGLRPASLAANASSGGTGSGASSDLSIEAGPTMSMTFQEYIGFFVLVVWLNRSDEYLPLLPPATRTRLLQDAKARSQSVKAANAAAAAAAAAARKREASVAVDGSGGAAGGDGAVADSKAVVQTTLWDLRHVMSSVRTAGEVEQLPLHGLQLTYALDIASMQLSAGPLTYAYGLVSRGDVCDVLFDVMRAERAVFVDLCRSIESIIAREAAARRAREVAELVERASPPAAGKGGAGSAKSPTRATATATTAPPSPTASPFPPSSPLRGCIPVVQVARVLLAMYPGYAQATLEHLIRTAVADGSNAAENPALLYYEVLLPSRMLPGPTTSTMALDSAMTTGTAFASLFYTAICDDARESMQMVADSIGAFARGQSHPESATGLSSSSAFAAAVAGAATATAQQLTSLAFMGIPRVEAQGWGPVLRSAIHRWPRLRATVADGPLGNASNTVDTGGATSGTSGGPLVSSGGLPTPQAVDAWLDGSEDASAGGAARGGGADEELHLSVTSMSLLSSSRPSRHRAFASISGRGGAGATSEDTAAAANVSTAARVPIDDVVPYLRQNLLLRRGPYDWAAAAAARANADSPAADAEGESGVLQWGAAHEDLLEYWEAQWRRYADLTRYAALPFVGPTELQEFRQLQLQVDPHRTCAWGSELLARENALVHPVSYSWMQHEPVVRDAPSQPAAAPVKGRPRSRSGSTSSKRGKSGRRRSSSVR